MAESLGALTGKLIFDTGDASEQMTVIEQQLEDLNKRFREGNMSADEYSARLKILSESQAELRGATVNTNAGAEQQGQTFSRYGRVMSEGEVKLRQFRQEQFLSNFVMREGTHSLVAMTFAITALTQNNEDAEGAVKAVERSLLTAAIAAQGTEFALFGMARAAIAAGGTMAVVGQAVEGAIMPIMILVGLGTALFGFMNSLNEEADKTAKEGLSNFLTQWKKLSDVSRETSVEGMKKNIADIRQQLIDLGKVRMGENARPYTEEEQALGKQLQARLDMYEKIISATEDVTKNEGVSREYEAAAQQMLTTQADKLIVIDALIESNRKNLEARKNILTGEALTEDQIQETVDNIAALEHSRSEILMSTNERAKEHLKVVELQHQLGMATVQDEISALNVLIQSSQTEAERLGYEVKRQELIKAESDLEKQRLDKQRKNFDAEFTAYKSLLEREQTASVAVIGDKHKRDLEAERLRHQKALDDIAEEAASAHDVDIAQRARDAENALNKSNNTRIQLSYDSEIMAARIAGVRNEQQALNMKYGWEQSVLTQQFARKEIDEKQYHALSMKLDREKADAQAQIEQRHIQGMLDSIQRLGAGIGAVFGQAGDKFVQSLQAALVLVRNILALVEKIKAAKEATSALDILGLFGDVLSFAAVLALAGGGELPSGSYVVNAQAASRHSGILDTIGAGTVVGGVPGRDSVFARSGGSMVALMPGERIVPRSFSDIGRAINNGTIQAMAYGGNVFRADAISGVSFPLSGSRGDVAGELKLLRQVNEALGATLEDFVANGLKGKLDIDNGQIFLRRAQSELDKFNQRKKVV